MSSCQTFGNLHRTQSGSRSQTFDLPIYSNSLYNLDLDGTVFRSKKVFVPEGIPYPSGRTLWTREETILYDPSLTEWFEKVLENGNVIDIVTARLDVEETHNDLAKWGVPYRRIYFGLSKGVHCQMSKGNDQYEHHIHNSHRLF